jgi:hypothetical protein
MKLSSIGSKRTYLRCMKDLHNYGYIVYQPSPEPFAPACVSVTKFTETGELELVDRVTFDTLKRIQKAPGNGIESAPQTVSKVHPSIKQYINKDKLGRNGAALQDDPSKKINPNLEEVKSYFRLAGFPEHDIKGAPVLKFLTSIQGRPW